MELPKTWAEWEILVKRRPLLGWTRNDRRILSKKKKKTLQAQSEEKQEVIQILFFFLSSVFSAVTVSVDSCSGGTRVLVFLCAVCGGVSGVAARSHSAAGRWFCNLNSIICQTLFKGCSLTFPVETPTAGCASVSRFFFCVCVVFKCCRFDLFFFFLDTHFVSVSSRWLLHGKVSCLCTRG